MNEVNQLKEVRQLVEYIKKNYNPNKQLRVVVDLFCGGGGTTSGFKKIPNTFVVACVNHDEYAIKSHKANHPYCIHLNEDIRDKQVIYKIEQIIRYVRHKFPNVLVVLHGSVDCTHFSKAKGGESRDADSRTLANFMIEYAIIDPDYITIENVEEFLSWGPLYQVEEKGRFKFKQNKKNVLFDSPYAGNEDLYDEIDAKPYMLPVKSRKGEFYNEWVNELKAFGFRGHNYDYKKLNAADFGEYTSRLRYFGVFAKGDLPISFPKPTHVSRKKHHLFPHLKPHKPVRDVLDLDNQGVSIFGLNKRGKEYVSKTVSRVHAGALKTIMESDNKAFISSYYGNSQDGQGIISLDDPCHTVTTKDRFCIHHLQYAYGTGGHSSLKDPAGTITTTPKHELVTMQWLFDHQFNRKAMSIDRAGPTIIAKQDKKPLYIASATKEGTFDNSIEKEGDSKVVKEIKAFMRKHGIIDILIRALEIVELLRIQGFPEDYILLGGSTRAKKYIGNSVCPGMAECFLTELLATYDTYKN